MLGARLASGLSAEELYAEQLDGAPKIDVEVTLGQTARFLWAALGSRDPQRSVQRLGRAALAADTAPESAVHEAIAVLLGGVRDWPGSDLRLTGVDARTGALEVFDATSGVTLPEAVAASCAVPVLWPPVSMAGRRWMDGGSRSTANVHLARGHRRVVAIAPIPKAVGPHPSATEQGAELAEDGTPVAVLTPDRASRKAFGRNMLDQTRCAAAAAPAAPRPPSAWTPYARSGTPRPKTSPYDRRRAAAVVPRADPTTADRSDLPHAAPHRVTARGRALS